MKHLVLMLSLATPYATMGTTSPSMKWQSWPQVGEATLTWGWWTIYQSSLRSPSGHYQPQSPHALVITYARDISDQRLMKATQDQWEHLGFPSAQRARWEKALDKAWGDIKEGDRLAFVRHAQKGVFYAQPKEKDWEETLTVKDIELADAFLAIWLSEDTDYPDHRRALLGETP
ncbi:hypothetical protein BZG74_10080 [Salinivibrio sharmensis]|uniref:Chalcone isomerase domain-containing protein n=2 Tax=Salinivibrio sharmensis TaxID=390883 RepID=A0ABX3KGB0_9GAMM|nr:hypothetical protein BZG74_10080 [Salinivibrio sharmensis]